MDELLSSDRSSELDIAVVGMAGRFPGARNLEEFWGNLARGVESIRVLTDAELASSGVEPAVYELPNYVRASPVLDDVETFDAAFFDISPLEAQILDPQRRLFLECAWEALESSGHVPERYRGQIGVYAGAGFNTYSVFNLLSDRALLQTVGDLQILISSDKDYLPTYASYKLNLTGPSVAVQTACSTSLVAIHLARQSLLVGECDMALAGGASVNVPHLAGHLYQEGSILCPDGHCRAFDAQAGGTIFGSGCGVVVLKRLRDAVEDRDAIRAVIKGSAVNNDGSTKVGYTAPGVEGQAAVIAQALASAGLSPDTISYVEAHGTGTELGDPVEVAALTQAFRTGTQATGFCALGSLKPNVGHLNAAAGVAGFIKTVLALEHRQLPPSLNYRSPNPKIDFTHSPFYVNTRLAPWLTRGEVPRRAGTSSMGIGGTNAHVILEEAPSPPLPASSARHPGDQIFVLSARTQTALEAATTRLAEHVETHGDASLPDVAYTLQVGRREFAHRRAVLSTSRDELLDALRGRDSRRQHTAEASQGQAVVFLFPGQGSQAQGMGRDLYGELTRFREIVDECALLLAPELGIDLRDVLFGGRDPVEAERQLAETQLAQPALFVVEYALARVLLEWGIRPAAYIGHSLGEYVAACLAGVFSLESTLRLVARRGRLMQSMPRGSMLSVSLAAERVRELLDESVSVAAVNGPEMCVVSGPAPRIEALRQRLARLNVRHSLLSTSHAFHSPMMDPIVDEFARFVARERRQASSTRLVSNVTGSWLTDDQAVSAEYWGRHLRQPVLFGTGMVTLFDAEPNALFVEVGPGRVLSVLTGLQRPTAATVLTLGAARGARTEVEALADAVGQIWTRGGAVEWAALHAESHGRIPLPTYPFERLRYWVDPPDGSPRTAPASPKQPDRADWFAVPSWTRRPLLLPTPAKERRRWLVFADSGQAGDALVGALEARGEDVARVVAGAGYERTGPRTFSVRPGEQADYGALVECLSTDGLLPDRVLHGWLLQSEHGSAGVCTPASFRTQQQRGFYSLLWLAQAMSRGNVTRPMTWTIATGPVHDVVGGEPLCPEQATLVGACRVVQQEYPNVTCRVVDLEPSCEAPLESLVAEACSVQPDPLVAYRGRHRWAQTYERVRLERRGIGSPFRREGVYLFTEGLFGLASELVEHIVDSVGGRLVLLEPESFPPEGRWSAWLAENDPQHLTSLKVRKALELRERGAPIIVLSVDLSDESQVRTAVASAEKHLGSVTGVIHASGGTSAGRIATISDIRVEDCERNFDEVALGMLAIDGVFRDRQLDFRLALGSLGSVLGGLGYVSYAAASAFMGAFASQLRAASAKSWQVHNWDSWTMEWESGERLIGLARDNFVDRILPTALTTEEGLDCFERTFALADATQVVISATDLQARYGDWVKRAGKGPVSASSPGTRARFPRPTIETTFIAPRNSTEEVIAEIFEEVLGLKEVGVSDSFYDLGGTSLSATQLIARLRETLALDIPLSAMFTGPTVEHLATVYLTRKAVRRILDRRRTATAPQA